MRSFVGFCVWFAVRVFASLTVAFLRGLSDVIRSLSREANGVELNISLVINSISTTSRLLMPLFCAILA